MNSLILFIRDLLMNTCADLSSSVIAFMQYLGINILDLIILVILMFYGYEGYILGFVSSFTDLLSFVLSFIIALKFYSVFGLFLGNTFGIAAGFARAISFFIVSITSEIILTFIFRRLRIFFPSSFYIRPNSFFAKLNRFFGIFPGLVSAFIILAFLLSVIISLPSSPFLKSTVISSRIGNNLVSHAGFVEARLNDIFGGALDETMNFLTVKPSGNETINLHFSVVNPSTDLVSEQEMLILVNKERDANGIPHLVFSNALIRLARNYASDMLQKGYFSHYNQEGLSPFKRMDLFGIKYAFAGENLALAPSTKLAMQGLLNSPGHRANILNGNFRKIGIGVLDGGIYGKMFVQEFTD